MKVYSDKITRTDIYAACAYVEGVYVDLSGVRAFTSKKGVQAHEFYLEGFDPRHTRARHRREGYAATWDDWGIVIERLFEWDADAVIGPYHGQSDFRAVSLIVASGGRMGWRGENRAPWLTEDVCDPSFRWPDEHQIKEDTSLKVRREQKKIR